MADVGRPYKERVQQATAQVKNLVADEAYLLRQYVEALPSMQVDDGVLDFGGQNEGDLFTFVPQQEFAERR